MALDQQGRKTMTLSPRTSAVLTGADDVATWDDDELVHGKRRDKNGNFWGQPPRVVPTACLRELTRRKIFDTESVIREAIVDAAKYLAGVAQGNQQPNSDRQRAAQVLLDRFLGKPKESVDVRMSVTAQVEDLPWVQALKQSAERRAARMADAQPESDDIIDVEVIGDDLLCACGCGQPPRSGSAYFNARHEARGKVRIPQPEPEPADDPILTDDDDFILDDEDDPILW